MYKIRSGLAVPKQLYATGRPNVWGSSWGQHSGGAAAGFTKGNSSKRNSAKGSTVTGSEIGALAQDYSIFYRGNLRGKEKSKM